MWLPLGPVIPERTKSRFCVQMCTKCHDQKAASEFHRDCNKPDGLRGRCRACEAAAGQARRMAKMKGEAPAADAKMCARCNIEKPGIDPLIAKAKLGLSHLSAQSGKSLGVSRVSLLHLCHHRLSTHWP